MLSGRDGEELGDTPILYHSDSVFLFSTFQYLATLRLNMSDILEIHNGIQFLPLDKNTYLRIQCFINLIEATFR